MLKQADFTYFPQTLAKRKKKRFQVKKCLALHHHDGDAYAQPESYCTGGCPLR